MMEECNKAVLSLDYVDFNKRLVSGVNMGSAKIFACDNILRLVKSIAHAVEKSDDFQLTLYQGELHGFITALSYCRKISDDLYHYLLSNFYYI